MPATPRLYFEDFTVGWSMTHGPRTITRQEIIAFASEYDPQPMHLDEEAAKKTLLGGLSASGWHTCAIMMRLIYDGLLVNAASMGAPSVDEVKWLKPVRPGDDLSVRLTVIGKREPKSRPDMGFVQCRCEVLNQHGEVVLDSNYPGMFAKRKREAAE
ncbi:MAG TPA: MaoC family dehydratase [Xanthobacteraceae bacterium]|jgi:acyl dehydratase|nr:MaoC family dehydratase [Xanthobacteraceae bacterium]